MLPRGPGVPGTARPSSMASGPVSAKGLAPAGGKGEPPPSESAVVTAEARGIGDIPEPPKLPLGLQLPVKTAAAVAAAVTAADTCPPTDQLVGASAAVAPAAAVAAVAAGVPCPAPPSRDGLSIARLLSVSSGKTDSSLPEVTSGYCGRGNKANAGVKSLTLPKHRRVNHAEPALPGAPQGTDERDQLEPLRKCGAPSLAGAETVGSRIDYSDLASILMDGGLDACKDGAEVRSETVSLGEDPYSDYALSAESDIFLWPNHRSTGSNSSAPATEPSRRGSSRTEQDKGLAGFDGIVDPSDAPDGLEASVLDVDAEDPYYYYF
ncbi:unnamed protein product [Ectocarpus sp. CCAP 1310/34]|nr:unnamed protein product [Ectocarpus sp. CCAP 1310/34]